MPPNIWKPLPPKWLLLPSGCWPLAERGGVDGTCICKLGIPNVVVTGVLVGGGGCCRAAPLLALALLSSLRLESAMKCRPEAKLSASLLLLLAVVGRRPSKRLFRELCSSSAVRWSPSRSSSEGGALGGRTTAGKVKSTATAAGVGAVVVAGTGGAGSVLATSADAGGGFCAASQPPSGALTLILLLRSRTAEAGSNPCGSPSPASCVSALMTNLPSSTLSARPSAVYSGLY
mmetsp:Transcript_8652/g.31901  ORF Transcript_8652/g.31901 Transcript_8652/m.31901 type:complete len:232 (+) Transcript_8652:3115-3810(+)